ncbi:unnamed protein product [Didymodactylos carnosus]|uniref:Uncharacterized protein n=1 Tax=Didymodactylos carnosus TaxID=1234261 RepID=A0A813X3V9_9BILA|nr:unnamed protein product [Didymodactylos carnosus]CAF0864555.1 unnamed protein product [Didymodactylos carnosus]CAF3640678.1 unnamed protein product [Didymodactylos carnosus]CAF3652083.1 unnamed protein product [Didymodactylos carnosus]
MSEQRNSTSPSLFPAQQSRPELPTILGNYVTEHDGVTDKIDGQHQRQTQQPSASRSNSNQLVDRNDDIILLTHNNESIQRSRRPTDVYARYRPNRHREVGENFE